MEAGEGVRAGVSRRGLTSMDKRPLLGNSRLWRGPTAVEADKASLGYLESSNVFWANINGRIHIDGFK